MVDKQVCHSQVSIQPASENRLGHLGPRAVLGLGVKGSSMSWTDPREGVNNNKLNSQRSQKYAPGEKGFGKKTLGKFSIRVIMDKKKCELTRGQQEKGLYCNRRDFSRIQRRTSGVVFATIPCGQTFV